MKREVKLLRQKALDSLLPSNVHRTSLALFYRGCVHSVLIFLDHAFEMLLKAAILHKGGKIRKRRAKQTIGFNACITGSGNSQIRFLKNEQAVSLQAISALRDAAQHYFREAEQISASISVRWKQNNFRAGDSGMLSLVTENNN